MFRSQTGHNVEVYIDDMLVKSLDEDKHLDNLQEPLTCLNSTT